MSWFKAVSNISNTSHNESGQDPESNKPRTPTEPSATSTPSGTASRSTASGSTSPVFGTRREARSAESKSAPGSRSTSQGHTLRSGTIINPTLAQKLLDAKKAKTAELKAARAAQKRKEREEQEALKQLALANQQREQQQQQEQSQNDEREDQEQQPPADEEPEPDQATEGEDQQPPGEENPGPGQAAGGAGDPDSSGGSSSSSSDSEFDDAQDEGPNMQAELDGLKAQITALQQALQAVGGAPVAGAGNRAIQGKVLTIPEFAAPTEGQSAELWISNLKRLKLTAGATDDQALNAALCALKGTAGLWRENLEMENHPACSNLATFYEEFVKRFGRERSASDLLGLLKNLKQKPNEPVRDFADRINLNLLTLGNAMKGKLADLATQPETDQRNAGFMTAFMNLRPIYFCSGLLEYLRTKIEPRYSETEDFDKLKELACELERTSKDSQKVMALESKSKADKEALAKANAEIAALKKSSQVKPGGNQGQNKSNEGNKEGTGPTRFQKKIFKVNKWKWCDKCKQWSKHIASECRGSKQQIASLTPMDPEVPPEETTVTDWYFDKLMQEN